MKTLVTCGRTSWDHSCGNGCAVLTSVSDSSLLDEKMVSVESLACIKDLKKTLVKFAKTSVYGCPGS